jgi:hypothetical protein
MSVSEAALSAGGVGYRRYAGGWTSPLLGFRRRRRESICVGVRPRVLLTHTRKCPQNGAFLHLVSVCEFILTFWRSGNDIGIRVRAGKRTRTDTIYGGIGNLTRTGTQDPTSACGAATSLCGWYLQRTRTPTRNTPHPLQYGRPDFIKMCSSSLSLGAVSP